MARFERVDADDKTPATVYMAKYPIELLPPVPFPNFNSVLIAQQKAFQEFGILKSLELNGDLTQPMISPTLPHFFGYRSWETINITNKANFMSTQSVFTKTTIGGNPNIHTKVVAGNSISIKPLKVFIPNPVGVFYYSNEPVEILPGTTIEVSSPLSYEQNTLQPVSHINVMAFCDRSYLDNRIASKTPDEPEEASAEAPNTRLITAYPNPAKEQVTIAYELGQASEVEIYISNAVGQKVATITQLKQQSEGKHEVVFDTSRLPAGMYIYTLQTATHKSAKRLIIK